MPRAPPGARRPAPGAQACASEQGEDDEKCQFEQGTAVEGDEPGDDGPDHQDGESGCRAADQGGDQQADRAGDLDDADRVGRASCGRPAPASTCGSVTSTTCRPRSTRSWPGAVREAITNVLRHSRSRHCSITVDRREGTVRLDIVNDRVAPRIAPDGRGLANLGERLRAAGGSIRAFEAGDGRFRVQAAVPQDVPAEVPEPIP